MIPSTLWLVCLALGVNGDSSSSSTSTDTEESTYTYSAFSFTNSFRTITTDIPTSAFTGSHYTYVHVTGQRTVHQSSSTPTGTSSSNATASSTSSNSQITASSKSVSLTVIGGVTTTANATNATASSTTSSTRPMNTVPCNGFPDFCARKYSNITQVTAHNAAFAVKNNAASNQELSITDQLNDGIRMLQGQVHWENNTMWNCHTSCSELNAGPWQDELETLRDWLQSHPYDVVTILIGNSDTTDVENFVPAITNAGLLPYVYEPAYVPQYRSQWPTLGEMIIKNQRLVIFMDYEADQSRVPYILDEFTHMWETPFSPVNQSFPCTIQRPPDLNETLARENYMYMANHNLNTAVDLSSIGLGSGDTILIPNTAEINLTNGQQNQFGRLGATNLNCTHHWGVPPNFLLVDYYNRGSPQPGSVFHVAAAANGVKYTQECCGKEQSAARLVRVSFTVMAMALVAGAMFFW
ncbi:hypothetical protein AC578_5535 [Pseudocercospora eumusae]|uniref:Phosphatidylinositol-specific phospholipase C X domain-containing protein n=1 Tax=Pseudocercospora eumusae TaxID=321146 RepID=A0A139H3B4_9PEZI|nr:hypothetical protein AC578_5535 [Pseudocercospora eumusae]